jgi:hypothetical protein
MELEQAGAVESPGSLLSQRSVPGLHGLCSGRRRRGTPTRREWVEQETPLLLSLSHSSYTPLPPSQHPNKRGPMAPQWGLADRDGDAGEALESACKGKCFFSRD